MISELLLGSFSPCLEEQCMFTAKQLYVLQDLRSLTAFFLFVLLSLLPFSSNWQCLCWYNHVKMTDQVHVSHPHSSPYQMVSNTLGVLFQIHFLIFCYMDRLKIFQIFKFWLLFCLTIPSSFISLYSHLPVSSQKEYSCSLHTFLSCSLHTFLRSLAT